MDNHQFLELRFYKTIHLPIALFKRIQIGLLLLTTLFYCVDICAKQPYSGCRSSSLTSGHYEIDSKSCPLGIYVFPNKDTFAMLEAVRSAAQARSNELYGSLVATLKPGESGASPTREMTPLVEVPGYSCCAGSIRLVGFPIAVLSDYVSEDGKDWREYPYTRYNNAFCWNAKDVACAVAPSCPDGYFELQGQCFPECGPGELRVANTNVCYCPDGAVCNHKNMGPPPSCPEADGGGNGGGGGGSGPYSPTKEVGNPIDSSLGNKFQVEVDYIDSVDPELKIKRIYNSISAKTDNTYFGNAWTWNFEHARDRSIVYFPHSNPPKVRVMRPDGNYFYYEKPTSGDFWIAEEATKDRLKGGVGSYDNWEYTPFSSTTTEVFTLEGHLSTIKLNGDTKLDLSYRAYPISSPDKIEKITNQNGRTIEVRYKTFGYHENSRYISARRIEKIITPDQQEIIYDYTKGVLTSVTYPGGHQKNYLYNEHTHTSNTHLPRALTGITDKDGQRLASWYYLPDGKAYQSEKGNGQERTTITYNADGSSTITNSLGKQSIYFFETMHGQRKLIRAEGQPTNNCAGANHGYTYYPNGSLQTKTDWEGSVTYYERDNFGRTTLKQSGYHWQNNSPHYGVWNNTQPVTNFLTIPSGETITSTQTCWHPTRNQPERIIEAERVTDFYYHPNGALQSKTISDKTSSNSDCL